VGFLTGRLRAAGRSGTAGTPGKAGPPGQAGGRTGLDFPRPLGTTARAAQAPWLLPDEPSFPGIAADVARLGGLDVRAASLVGPGHRCAEPALPRQDAYRLGRDPAGAHLIVAVADGMSDSALSHVGANVAVTALVARLRADLGEGVPLDGPSIFLAAARQMVGAAVQREATEHEVRCAALVAAVPARPAADGRRSVWLSWVADVGAWTRIQSGWERVAGDEDGGLDQGQLTEFLPFHPAKANSTTVVLEPGAVLALATDGIGTVFREGAAAWFAERWTGPPHITSFVEEVGYESRGQLDDRTAVVIWCDQ
jgi:protein phosphatase 2C-like protein